MAAVRPSGGSSCWGFIEIIADYLHDEVHSSLVVYGRGYLGDSASSLMVIFLLLVAENISAVLAVCLYVVVSNGFPYLTLLRCRNHGLDLLNKLHG